MKKRDYIETEDVVKEWRQSNETEELNKGSGEKGGNVDAARQEDSVVEPRTPPITTSIFDDEDITMAQTLIKMKEEKAKEKGVSIKDIEDSSRPARSILTLKPLPTIDPKDKGKSVLEEPEPAKKMTRSDFDAAQIARDAEIARQLQVDLQAEVERERQREEEASKAAIAETYDEVQAGIDADALFAAKLQQEEREEYTIEERAKFLAETIAAQRKFRAAQRSAEIRSRPPTKSQLRNLMMTYLKNMGGYKHSQLKAKTFAEIQGLYERQKRVIDDFKPMDSDDAVKDSKEAAGVHKQKVLEEPNSTKVEVKQEGHEESIRKRPGRRLKMKATKKSKRQKTDADLEEEEQLKAFLKIVPDEEGIIDYEVLEKRFPIINWESKFYDFDRHGAECIYYRIFRSDGSSRWIKTFSEMVTRFDRLDLEELYNLVMKRFETTTPEGVDLVLWGDLKIMFDANAEDELWKYPLTKETLERMLSLRLVAGTASEDAYTLLRFIQKQIDEYGSHDGAMTKINDVEANLEQFKSETLAWQKETSNRFDRMQESIDKNKADADRQFAELLQILKALQLPTIHQISAAKTYNLNEKVKTARVNKTTAGPKAVVSAVGNPQYTLQDQGIFNSGCSRHMTGNKSFLTDYQEVDGGFVAFAGSPKGGKITGKGKIRTGKLDFKDVYFVKELKFNLFSVSQMCDKKNSVLFIETECLVLSPDFKLLDESQVLLKVPRQNNMYSFDLKNVIPSGGLTCLFAKAKTDESKLWHKRLGYITSKIMNKLVKGNLVRGLPSKLFENDHTCVACQKGKQHKASCKTKLVSSISQPLQMLHMDLFGPTSVRSINHKTYCLVVTDDYSRFSWVFFLATKDETSGILKTFITGIENQINHKVKIIRCDNGTEFKNNDMNQFCGMKGIKREFSVARTPQQNGVAERKNRTLIEAARTMLADSLLPTTFWAEAVSTACYVQNRVLVTKPHNKTPYELLHGRPPSISFMRPFGCPVTILNTLDPLGKFDEKADEGFFVGYSINSKAFRVFNTRTRKVEENLHINFLKNKPNVAGSRPEWLFDIDLLTNSMNYEPVTAGNQTNKNAVANDVGKKTNEEPANKGERNGQEKEEGASNKENDQNVQDFRAELENLLVQQKEGYANSTNRDSTVSLSVSTAGQNFTNADHLLTDPLMPDLEDTANLLNTGIFSGTYNDEDEGAEADLNNLETTMNVSLIPIIRIHKDHPKDQIIGNINSATQTKRMTKNKKDERGIVVRNKARLVAQGYTQEEGIDYDKVFAPVAKIEAIRLFLAYASFMGFIVYQMDVNSAFLYGTIEEDGHVVDPFEYRSFYLVKGCSQYG
ncbi:putative ribonuclease H-like domain-containing protein [Tanacetum coccineum]|uniref:Ribonuclease H-like domain-containing protein n=1 Tax=Tanacetum coccineum TaxID=301880 RepID=A0ABQ4Z1H2_9ASTR